VVTRTKVAVLLRTADQPLPPQPCQPSTKQGSCGTPPSKQVQNFPAPRFYDLTTFMKWFLQSLHNSSKANTKGKGGGSSSFSICRFENKFYMYTFITACTRVTSKQTEKQEFSLSDRPQRSPRQAACPSWQKAPSAAGATGRLMAPPATYLGQPRAGGPAPGREARSGQRPGTFWKAGAPRGSDSPARAPTPL